MRQQVIVTTCDRPGCEAETIDRRGWGRWAREGRTTSIDVCPEHDREMCQMFARMLAPGRGTRRRLQAVKSA